jgi:hypothetical protein
MQGTIIRTAADPIAPRPMIIICVSWLQTWCTQYLKQHLYNENTFSGSWDGMASDRRTCVDAICRGHAAGVVDTWDLAIRNMAAALKMAPGAAFVGWHRRQEPTCRETRTSSQRPFKPGHAGPSTDTSEQMPRRLRIRADRAFHVAIAGTPVRRRTDGDKVILVRHVPSNR